METGLTPAHAIDLFRSRLKPMRCLVVAVSGGGDSTALLHLLHERRSILPRLVAVTVDHGLRPDSAVEAEAVAALCARIGMEYQVVRWTGRKPRTGLQDAARLARYELLRQSAHSLDAGAVLTGHTRDDQIETAIMRRARGPGRGLAGMAQAMLFQEDCWVLRPLLAVRREDLRTYLVEAGLEWMEDPSNSDERFERVRLRQSGPSAADAEVLSMVALAAMARRDDAEHLARFVEMHIRLHGGIVAEVPQVPPEFSEHQQQAIALFAALMGGRSHLPGAQQQTRIARFAAGVGPPRLSVAGSIVDRRADRIFVYRERRGQKCQDLDPDHNMLWDGRYRVRNTDTRNRYILAPTPRQSRETRLWPETDADWARRLPPGVVARARAGEPTILAVAQSGEQALTALPAYVTVRRHLAPFDLFLPDFDFILANRCATLFGRTGYPPKPLGPA